MKVERTGMILVTLTHEEANELLRALNVAHQVVERSRPVIDRPLGNLKDALDEAIFFVKPKEQT